MMRARRRSLPLIARLPGRWPVERQESRGSAADGQDRDGGGPERRAILAQQDRRQRKGGAEHEAAAEAIHAVTEIYRQGSRGGNGSRHEQEEHDPGIFYMREKLA